MRQVAIALILINFLALATGSAHVLAQTPAGIRPGDGVGPVRLGMSPAEVQAALGGPPSERYSNGWWLWANQKIDVYFYQGRALMIDTESPELATAEGIRIGSTDVDLIKAYGAPVCSGLNQYRGQAYLAWIYDGAVVFLNGSPRATFMVRVLPAGSGKAICN
ncbi:MAG TPA: hypothetical protein VJA65_07770 [bacterium]|nr:hypothetical protein [bacterium]